MKLVISLALVSLAASMPAHADTAGCAKTAPHWVKGPVHGKEDQFASSCYEPAHPTPGLVSAYSAHGPTFSDFDSTTHDQHFLHTMNRFPDAVVGATLTIRLRPFTDGWPYNDTIALRFVDPVTGLPDTDFFWSQQLGNWDQKPGLSSTLWADTLFPEGHLLTLDLCDLPILSGSANPNLVSDLVPYLDLFKYLDIVVQDDTAVDFVELKLTYCCVGSYTAYAIPDCDPSGEPSPFLWAAGCFKVGGTLSLGLEQAPPYEMAGLFLGLGDGSVPLGPTSTLDVLPLIGAPIIVPLGPDGEFEMFAALPPVTVTGISLNMQAVILNTATGGLRSSNAVSFTID